MRSSILDIALSTGLEGLDTPPAPIVEATLEIPADDDDIVSSRAVALGAAEDLQSAKQTITDLTRLGNGLEGLMIEVANLENKEEQTSEELAALRVSAQAVRRQFLTEDERQAFDGVLEGRLEGSTEGLGDLMKNVSTKLGYAVGNFFDSVKRSWSGNKDMLTLVDSKLVDTLARLQGLPEVQYERLLSKEDAVIFSMNGKVDAQAVLADLLKAIDAWYYQPMLLTIDRIDLLSAHLAETLATTTEEAYSTVVESKADLYSVPLPASADKADTVTGKYYMFDLFDVYGSYGTRNRTVYVARPNKQARDVSPQYANAAALSVSYAVMTHLRNRSAQPAKVSFTKAELIAGVQTLRAAVKELLAYVQQQDLIVKSYRTYVQATANYENFKKNSFVDKQTLARVGAQAGAILSLFDMTCISFYATTSDIDRMAGILKAFVYSSDLSKG